MLNLLLVLFTTLAAAPAGVLDVETSIRPVSQDRYQLLERAIPGMYRCEVFVHDEADYRRVWGTNEMLIAPGGSAQKTVVHGALRLDARASMTKEKDRAEVRVTIYRDDVVVHRQTSRVDLR